MSLRHIAVLFISICCLGCSKNETIVEEEEICESIVFEDQFLESEIDIFEIYKDVEKVVFVGTQNDEYKFEIDYFKDTMVYNVNEALCLEDTTIYKSFNGQSKSMLMLGPENLKLFFTHRVDYWRDEELFDESSLVDYLRVTQSQEDPSGSPVVLSSWTSIITSDRGGVMNIDSLNYRWNETQLYENQTVFGKYFEDVYGNDYMEMYFSKELGVVSFTSFNNKRFVFDRFEY